MKISKEINDKGKVTFEKKSNVKNRRKMPRFRSKAHVKEKGKGSYNRKNAFKEDEDEENESDVSYEYRNGPGSVLVRVKDGRKSALRAETDEYKKAKEYIKKGTKKKGGKIVNNCVKENTEIQAFVEAIINEEPSKAFDHLRKAVEIKLQSRIEAEIDKPIF